MENKSSNSERMKINNPMFNEESKRKRLFTLKGKNPLFNPWNKKEEEFLRNNYLKLSNIEISNYLNRKPSQISKKLTVLKIKRDIESLNKIRSRLFFGNKNPFYGKIPTKESLDKRLKTIKERYGKIEAWDKGLKGEEFLKHFKKGKTWQTGLTIKDERIKKITDKRSKTLKERDFILRGKKHPHYGKNKENSELFKKISERMKNGGALKARKANESLPNKPEKLIIKIIRENNLYFYYVGDGKIWFIGITQHFNPDFINKEKKLIIELFGDYWHNRKDSKIRDIERLETYSKYGYKTLIIWDYELKNPESVLNKIKEFVKNDKV